MTPKLLDPRPAPSSPARPRRPPKEQRRHPRKELPVRCWIVDGEHTIYLRVHDLSRGGLSVRAPVPFPPAGPIELRVELPSGGTVRARGQVVWVRPEGGEAAGQPRMGARFVEFLDGEAALERSLGASGG